MFAFGWGHQVYKGCRVLIWLGIGKVVGGMCSLGAILGLLSLGVDCLSC